MSKFLDNLKEGKLPEVETSVALDGTSITNLAIWLIVIIAFAALFMQLVKRLS